MAEELEEVLRKFELTDKEVNGIQLEGGEVFQGIEECKMGIIGKVVGEKNVNISGIKSFSSNLWSFAKNLRVIEIGVNMFQFILSNRYDMDRILHGRPWIFDNLPLVLLPWREGIEHDTEAFSRTWIWVQMWNLPLHWVTKEIGKRIGGVFNKVSEVIIPPGGEKRASA